MKTSVSYNESILGKSFKVLFARLQAEGDPAIYHMYNDGYAVWIDNTLPYEMELGIYHPSDEGLPLIVLEVKDIGDVDDKGYETTFAITNSEVFVDFGH